MALNKRLTILIFLAFLNVFGQDQKLKKITIVENNNPLLRYNYNWLNLPDSINNHEFKELKEYVLSKTTLKSKNEPELFYELMDWVSNQWKHNGWHAAPDSLNSLGILKSAQNDGEEYRCVEYGIVLNDILNSFGYTARTIGLKHVDVDYGGAGMGHVATEVWSNKFNKWIFLDPQFGIYAVKDSLPLNIYEIYQIKTEGDFNKIDFFEVKTNKSNRQYGDEFLTNYLGYMNIKQKVRDLSYTLVLKMEGKRDFLTFQAFPSSKNIFTIDAEDVYYDMNQVSVLLDYNETEIDRSAKEFAKLNIETVEDFKVSMPLFAAKPIFVLYFDNNMPWFKSYHVQLNNQEIREEDGKYYIYLNEGINTLKVTAVNQNDIEGIPTIIKLKYE